MMIGTRTAATMPAAKPLLYKLRPACRYPTLNAADECTNPATTPQYQPNRPAIGASVVPKSAASTRDGSDAFHGLAMDPTNTPSIIGTMFFGCLPNAENPMI